VISSVTEGVAWRDVALRTRCGTPGYAAPEVISAEYAPGLERRYGLECDMWAVGVVVYILVRWWRPPRQRGSASRVTYVTCAACRTSCMPRVTRHR
jgi:serine/threonine protein kinase